MATNGFQVKFVFDGRLAEYGELDGSDYAQTADASRRLLATHAHCWATGRIPFAAVSNTQHYQIRHAGSWRGSHVDLWNVVLNVARDPATTAAIAAATFGETSYPGTTRQAISGAARFLKDSLRYAMDAASYTMPQFPRIEPVLEMQDGNHEPLLDVSAESDRLWAELRTRTRKGLHELARPVGRSADTLCVWIDDELVATFDETTKRRFVTLSDLISEAVIPLQQSRQGGSLRF